MSVEIIILSKHLTVFTTHKIWSCCYCIDSWIAFLQPVSIRYRTRLSCVSSKDKNDLV